MGTYTISVEHVRDVADGYVGEIIMAKGIPWIRYRVWPGPKETVTRIDIDMTSMVGASPGDVPMPLLTARRGRDSIVISPADGVTAMGTLSKLVPSAALLAIGFSTTSDEQAIRRARELGTGEVTIPLVEPMNGQIWNSTITPLPGDIVRLKIGPEEWNGDSSGTIEGQPTISVGAGAARCGTAIAKPGIAAMRLCAATDGAWRHCQVVG